MSNSNVVRRLALIEGERDEVLPHGDVVRPRTIDGASPLMPSRAEDGAPAPLADSEKSPSHAGSIRHGYDPPGHDRSIQRDDEDRCRRLGENGRLLARDWTWENAAARHIEIYESLVGSND